MRRSIVLLALFVTSAAARDPLAEDVARWQAFLKQPAASQPSWKDVKPIAESVLPRVEDALRHGRRELAIYRFATVRPLLEAAAYAAHHSDKEFDREWKRNRPSIPAVRDFESIAPAAARGLAEASALRARGYYDASRDYAANTTLSTGLFYIGQSHGERSTIDFLRSLNTPAAGRSIRLRSLAPDIDSLRGEVLAAYQPPRSIDNHPQFIAVSALVNEARELDAAGFRDGALVRYLEAALRLSQIMEKPLPRMEVESQLRAFTMRVRNSGSDNSIGEIYLQSAESDLDAKPNDEPKIASAVVTDVLPRYFAALAPAARQPQLTAAPRATVTLVRWPYT